MDSAKGIWAVIGVGIALAGLMMTQHASLRQEHTVLQSQITNLVDRTARLETHVGILREDMAYLTGRRNELESPPPDQPLEAP